MNKFINNEKGIALVMTGMFLSLLLIITAFAIDFGYLYVVKNQVQNSADAAALSGADVLFTNAVNPNNFNIKGGGFTKQANCAGSSITEQAVCTAASKIALNEPSTYTFTVNVDLWNQMSPPGSNNYPAVKVNLTRTFVPYFFAKVFGYYTTTISASATAICQASQTTGVGAKLLPLALNTCVFYNGSTWNHRVGQTLTVGTSYPTSSCDSMQWSSLDNGGEVGASTIASIITDGTTEMVGIAPNAPNASTCSATGSDGVNTCIHIESGVKNSDFKTLNDYVGQNFVVPVVYEVDTGTNQPVEAFACVKLTNTCNSWGYFGTYTGGQSNSTEPDNGASPPNKCPGNKAYISLTIVDSNCSAGGTGSGGNYTYGVTSSPQLAD